MYARTARFNRSAWASLATARTWRVSTTPPRAIAPTSVKLASTLLSLRMQPSLLFCTVPYPIQLRLPKSSDDCGGEGEVFEVSHRPLEYATGCWFVPDMHHRHGEARGQEQ